MNLSELQKLLLDHRRKVFLALGFVILATFAIAVLTSKNRGVNVTEEEKLPPLFLQAGIGSVVGQLDLGKLPNLEVPGTIKTYQAVPSTTVFTIAEAQEIAARFGLGGDYRDTPLEDGSRLISFNQGEETVAVTTRPRDLRYIQVGFSYSSAAVKGTLYDAATATQKARAFMEEKKLPTNQLLLSQVRYLNSGSEIFSEVKDPAQADLAEVSFSRALDRYGIWGETPVDAAARVLFNRAGKVVLLNFKFPDQSFTQLGEAKLRSLKEASGSLPGEGIVVSLRPSSPDSEITPETGDLTSFNPDSVQLAYLLPIGSTYLYPAYIFEGDGLTSEGEVRAVVVISALQPQYIRSKE